MTVKRRLVGAFGASILGPAVTILVQLVNVPVMLRVWGPHLYGEWLLISTIPAYLLLTDLGFGNVAGTDMTMRANAGDHDGAIETFQSIAALVLVVSFSFGLLLSTVIFFLPIYSLLHMSSMSPAEMKLALFILCINCLIILQWSVIIAAYRCDGQYARGMLYVNLIRILEGVSFLVLLISNARPVQLALLMLGISVLGTCGLLVAKLGTCPQAAPDILPDISVACAVCFDGARTFRPPYLFPMDTWPHYHGSSDLLYLACRGNGKFRVEYELRSTSRGKPASAPGTNLPGLHLCFSPRCICSYKTVRVEGDGKRFTSL